MSNCLQPLNVVQCKEPLLDFHNPSYCAKLPTNLKSFQINNTQTFSNSAISAKLEISNTAQVIDRNIILDLPLDVAITGTTSTGKNILLDNCWAVRSNALGKMIQTINIQYGNSSYAFSSSDVMSMLEHYNAMAPMKYKEDFQPQMLDASQTYDVLFGSPRNPLNLYSEGTDTQWHRGAQPIWQTGGGSQYNPGTIVNTSTNANFSMLLSSLVLSSPLLDKLTHGGSSYGLSHLNNLNIDITFVPNLANRLLSFMRDRQGDVLSITNINITVNKPVFRYIQISDKEPIPRLLSYSLNTIERYPSDVVLSQGVLTQVNSQVIQLSRIPNYAMVAVRPSNQVYNAGNGAGVAGCQIPDAFCAIQSINVLFDGQTLFANSDPSQLYKIAVESGCVDNFPQWAGYSMPLTFNSGAPTFVQGAGSVLKLVFGRDVSLLKENLASGVNYRTNLQINMNVVNLSPLTQNFTYYMVLCYDDIIQIFDDNNANICSAPLSQNDVLSAEENSARVSYDSLRDHNLTGGKGFLSGLSNVLSHGHKNFDTIKKMYNSPLGQCVSAGVGAVLKGRGGAMGGKMASKGAMKNSMVQY